MPPASACRRLSPAWASSVYCVNGDLKRRRPGLRTIVWFRGKDLRVGDHEPLARAAAEGEVIPLFVLEPRYFGPGRASRAPHRMQFLLESLTELQEGLSERGSGLVLLEGPSTSALPRVAAQWKVDRVWAHRGSEPGGRATRRSPARWTSLSGSSKARRSPLRDTSGPGPAGPIRSSRPSSALSSEQGFSYRRAPLPRACPHCPPASA